VTLDRMGRKHVVPMKIQIKKNTSKEDSSAATQSKGISHRRQYIGRKR
jgi:hypothetical protein